METLKKIETQLEKELDKIAMKSDLTANDLEALHYATKVMKCLKELEEMDWYSDGYSNKGPTYYNSRMPVTMNRNYPDYDRGYSRHSVNDRAIDRLEKMMDEAGSEYERTEISKIIRMIRASQ